jgi:hypothetical protein
MSPYCVGSVTPIRCPSPEYTGRRESCREKFSRRHDVQLLPCNRPSGSLETAPRTSLRVDSAEERWEGFWSDADEGYYTRCTYADGTERWFRLADEAPREERFERPRSRVIKFSSNRTAVDIVTMRLMAAQGGRPILVGTSRRRSRPAGAGR